MANCNITSRTPIAGSFFSTIGYIPPVNPPVPTRFCVSRPFLPSIQSLKSMAYMETLCAHVLIMPTSINANPDNSRLIIEALSIEIQVCLSLLEKRPPLLRVALSP